MARRRAGSGRGRGKLPPWALLLIGLTAGALIAWTVHLYLTRSDARNAAVRTPANPRTQAPPPAPKPAPPATPEPAKPPKPRYDFYTILPEIERIIPDSEPRKTKGKTKEDETRYILQAASFAHFEDADRLKAKLALSGMEARIEKITIEGKGDFFRVRLGPYKTLEGLNVDNSKLRALGVKAIRLEIKNAAPS